MQGAKMNNSSTGEPTTKKPEVFFVLKENSGDKGKYISALEYPFIALGGLPNVGDLVKFDENSTYRIYLRTFDYSDVGEQVKVYLYVIKATE
jgi:hypothetical protein